MLWSLYMAMAAERDATTLDQHKYNEAGVTYNDARYLYDGSLVDPEIVAPRKNARRVDSASRPASSNASRPASLSTGKRTCR